MLISTIIMGVLAVILLVIGYFKGQHIAGLKLGMGTMIEILPLLILALIVSGMIQVLVSDKIISEWLGESSGVKGILIASVAGSLTPGGPFVSLPLAAGLFRSGASIGTLVAFLTGWALLSVHRLPMEVGILGWKFTLIRLVSTIFLPPFAGFLAQTFFGGVR